LSTYWALFKMEFQQHLQYRVAAVAGALTNIAFGFFRLFLLTAFYGATDTPQPMDLPDLYSYIWFGQVLFGVLPLTGIFGPEAEDIRSGAVAYRLTRPVSLYRLFLARAVGQKTTALCTRSLIQVVVLLLVLPLFGLARYGMRAPNLRLLPLLALSLLMTLFLSAAIQTLIQMSCFWTITVRGSAALSYAVISLFSGLLVPLAFFPPMLLDVARILPFRALYDTPALIYTGSLSTRRALLSLGHQGVWLVLLTALGSWLAHRGIARLEVAGG
jgi:ABC-2 type transport system permease protein